MVEDVKAIPFTWPAALQVAASTLLPALPLALTMISLEELLKGLLKIVL